LSVLRNYRELQGQIVGQCDGIDDSGTRNAFSQYMLA
jgi:hypothetical protein